MTRQDGIVVGVERDGSVLLVEIPQRAGTCGNCANKGGCQTGLLGMGPGKTRYRVPNRFGAGLGDRVSLTVADGTVVSAALYSYLVPALMTILMAAVGQAWFGNVGAIMGALVGLVLSVALLRRRESLLGAGDEILVAARPSKVDCDELERRK